MQRTVSSSLLHMAVCTVRIAGVWGLIMVSSGACQVQTTTGSGSTGKGKADKTAQTTGQAPTTKAPIGSVTTSSFHYDPAKDPANKGGFALSAPHCATDPKDRSKKPFDIEALYKMRYVGSPVWSPDGSKILFTVSSYDLKKGKSNREIYLIRADGSGLRRMTRCAETDTSPNWWPDGKSFVFLSTRNDKAELWRMPIDGGEPQQLTTISTGASAAKVSPDGKHLAFTSRIFPEYGADDTKNEALIKDMKKSPLKVHMGDELLFRHWTFYRDGKRTHILVQNVPGDDWDAAKGPKIAPPDIWDVTPGDFDSPAFSLSGDWFDISPDGKEICFESNRQSPGARAWGTDKDLIVVPLSGGRQVNLTKANKAFDGYPRYSPDGRYIAFLRQEKPGYESDMFRMALYDRKAGTIKIMTPNFDNWIVDYRWVEGGKAIIFKGAVKGRFPLFRLDVKSGTIARLKLPSVRAFDVSSKGRIAFTFTRVHMPIELFVADRGGSNPKRVTFFNKGLVDRYDIRPAEETYVQGAGGRKMHLFVVKPHGFVPGKRYPLIINIHGGPQYQWSDSFRGDWQVYPGAGYVVAFFNPHGSIGYGQAYTAAISKDWGGKVYRDVMAVTDWLSKQSYVDPKRMGAMGWSYGGYAVNWLEGHTTRFKALASMMGLYDLVAFYGGTEELWFPEWDVGGTPWTNPAAYKKWSPSTYAAKFATPMLILTGEKDFRSPYTQSIELFTTLRRRNIPARIIIFPSDGHWPNYVRSMPLYYAAHLDWFHKYLGGGPSPWDIKTMIRGRVFKESDKKDKNHR